MVFPVVLGSAKRVFGAATPWATLYLASTPHVGPAGVCIVTYRPT